MPEGHVRDLGQHLRHRPRRRLRLPGSKVAVFVNGPWTAQDGRRTRLLLASVQVIAVGADHRHHRDHDGRRGSADHRAAAADAVHARRRPGGGGEGASSPPSTASWPSASQREVEGQARPPASPSRTSSGDPMPIIVESNTANAELFLSVSGAGHHGGGEPRRRCSAPSRSRPTSTRSCSGPASTSRRPSRSPTTCGCTRPAVSVILMRRRVDTCVLAEALRSGMREVVEERDLTGLGEAIKRAHQVFRAVTGARASAPSDSPAASSSRSSPPRAGSARPRSPPTSRSRSPRAALRVCLVDLDLGFGDIAITLQLFPARTIADAVALESDLDFTCSSRC